MGRLANVLYPLPDTRRSPLSLLGWWESRRMLYNRVVGATGLITTATVYGLFSLSPFGPGAPPLEVAATIAATYGLCANVCYSLGWLCEIGARALWGREAPDIGPLLFREGLIFSVGLTLVPAAMATLAWVMHAIMAIF